MGPYADKRWMITRGMKYLITIYDRTAGPQRQFVYWYCEEWKQDGASIVMFNCIADHGDPAKIYEMTMFVLGAGDMAQGELLEKGKVANDESSNDIKDEGQVNTTVTMLNQG